MDLGEAHNWIVSELDRRRPVAESMDRLIDWCETEQPHSDWERFRTLSYGDLTPLMEWLQQPFREEPAIRPLKGLWFGLFHPCPDGRTPVTDIYVCGSERFDPTPGDNDWAVGPDWWPDSRYADSEVLADIYRIAYRQREPKAEREGCLGTDAGYPLCLGYGVFAVRQLLEQVDPALILGGSSSVGIAVGFDSGDFVLLGELTADGLKPIDPSAKRPQAPFEPVLEDIRSADDGVVFRALYRLRRFGDRARDAIPDLVRLAATGDSLATRQSTLGILAEIGPDDPRAKATILQALKDPSPFIRREALQALIKIKDLSAEDLARIAAMEHDPDEDVARWSEIALRNIRLRRERR